MRNPLSPFARLACVFALGLSGPVAAAEPDLVTFDFETEAFDGWTVTGNAFGSGPVDRTLPDQMPVSGWQGDRYVSSYHGGDASVGSLQSPAFTIERTRLRFLVGGGERYDLRITLLLDGEPVRTATGPMPPEGMSERLVWSEWEVEELMGKDVRLQITDQATGQWGHLCVDQVVQTDRPLPTVEREVTISLDGPGRFVNLAVADGGPTHKAVLSVGGEPYRTFDIALATDEPSYWVSVPLPAGADDVSMTIAEIAGGREALARAVVRAELSADTHEDYREPARPQFHFTARRGWINDPNGMVWADGVWHLYFQHNPFGWHSAQKHWGHAVSRDLLHWEELGTALAPYAYRDEVYSGSAVVDANNTSGWGTTDHPPIVAAYTSTARGECIVYSTDGGLTFTEFEGNPVVVHDEIGRDPRLLWDAEHDQWVMAVYRDRAGKQWIAFYTSPDLKAWTYASEIEGFYECPDLIELPVDGDPDNTRWILYGADLAYLVGEWDGKIFEPVTAGKLRTWHGSNYAAQTFSHAPDNRTVQVGWMLGGNFPGAPFNQQMSAFVDLTLRDTGDAGLRLFANPIPEYDALRGEATQASDLRLTDGDVARLGEGESLDVVASFDVGDARSVGLTVRGRELAYDTSTNRLRYGDLDAPLPLPGGTLDLRVLIDRGSVEVFAEDGYLALSAALEPGEGDATITAFARGGTATLRTATLYPMQSIWNPRPDRPEADAE